MTESDHKLHLGSGSITLPGWINIDLDSPTADQLLDLTDPLPFESASVSHIFNEHFIEHITREQAVAFLKECYRVLKQQGVMRITTPNLRFLAHSYFSDNRDEWGDLWQPNSRCQLMNEGMRSWGHKFLYDAEELTRILGEAGFKSITFETYRQSRDEILVSLESRPFHNELIVEARKSSNTEIEVNFATVTENEATWNFHSDARIQITEQSLTKASLESAARAEFIEVLSAQIRELEARLAGQAQDSVKIAAESSARADFIDTQSAHIHALEARLTEQAQVSAKAATESSARADFIEAQSAHIHELEARLAEQAQASANIATESSARAEFIDALSAHIRELEAILTEQKQRTETLQLHAADIEIKLKAIESSWCGKINYFFNRNA